MNIIDSFYKKIKMIFSNKTESVITSTNTTDDIIKEIVDTKLNELSSNLDINRTEDNHTHFSTTPLRRLQDKQGRVTTIPTQSENKLKIADSKTPTLEQQREASRKAKEAAMKQAQLNKGRSSQEQIHSLSKRNQHLTSIIEKYISTMGDQASLLNLSSKAIQEKMSQWNQTESQDTLGQEMESNGSFINQIAILIGLISKSTNQHLNLTLKTGSIKEKNRNSVLKCESFFKDMTKPDDSVSILGEFLKHLTPLLGEQIDGHCEVVASSFYDGKIIFSYNSYKNKENKNNLFFLNKIKDVLSSINNRLAFEYKLHSLSKAKYKKKIQELLTIIKNQQINVSASQSMTSFDDSLSLEFLTVRLARGLVLVTREVFCNNAFTTLSKMSFAEFSRFSQQSISSACHSFSF